jgi:serine/threonine protein kinase
MVERWRQGERIPAEAYLQLHPCLQDDSPEAFEVVYAELTLREQYGEAPALREYLWRFPRFAGRLERQIGLHRALAPADTNNTVAREGEPPPERTNAVAGIGPAVPGYEVLEELGRGGMGVVYKARQLSLNRVVALKVIRDSALASAEEVSRFQREAELAAVMQHPHIVQIYEVGRWEGHSYLALECLEGGTLEQRLAGNPQDPAFAARVVETLARAIQHAHQRGIIHRDLKPANVLLQKEESGRLKDESEQSPPTFILHPSSFRRLPTSAWPSSWAAPLVRPGQERCWARPATWPPNRRPAGTTPSMLGPTCTRWEPSSTKC